MSFAGDLRLKGYGLAGQVNGHRTFAEQLCGLSKKAIERWLNANRIDPNGEVAVILLQISSKLFFLASKSQEQVTEDYRMVSADIHSLTMKLEDTLKRSA